MDYSQFVLNLNNICKLIKLNNIFFNDIDISETF